MKVKNLRTKFFGSTSYIFKEMKSLLELTSVAKEKYFIKIVLSLSNLVSNKDYERKPCVLCLKIRFYKIRNRKYLVLGENLSFIVIGLKHMT